MRVHIWKDPKVWIGILISALFIWLALRSVPLSQIENALRKADYGVILPAVLLNFTMLWIRSLRWGVLLTSVKRVPSSSLFRATTIGYMANYLLPIRVGELVRAYLVGTREGISRSAAFATVVLERLVDIFSILIVFLAITYFLELPQGSENLQSMLRMSALILFAIGVAIAGLLWMVRARTQWFTILLDKSVGKLVGSASRHLTRRVISFAEGLSLIKGARNIFKVVIYTALIWTVTAGAIMVVAEGFHFGLPGEVSWLVLVALAFGVSVPAGPGFVGTFHYAAIVCLLLYGIPRPDALSYAIVLHAVMVIPVLLLGLLLLWGEGLSLSRLLELEKDNNGNAEKELIES